MPLKNPVAVMVKLSQPPGSSRQAAARTRRTGFLLSLPLALKRGKIMLSR